MTSPVKAPKKPKNQPVTFQETIASAPTYAPVADVSFRLSDRQQRWSLRILWVLVTLLVGAAVGWRIVSASNSAVAVPGAPVSTNSVVVSSLNYSPAIGAAAAPTQPALTVQPDAAATQAAAGSPFAVLAAGSYQPADVPDALTPGYQTAVAAQGSIGTASVR